MTCNCSGKVQGSTHALTQTCPEFKNDELLFSFPRVLDDQANWR